MRKTKKMSHKEMKETLRNFDNMSKSEQENLASINNISVEELKHRLQNNCYNINNLGIRQMKSFRKELEHMGTDEITVVEKVNNMEIHEIVKSLEKEISDYNEKAKKIREFNEAWEIRKLEVYQELIDTGVINVCDGYSTIDIITQRNRLAEEKRKLAQKMGVKLRNENYTNYPF